jgi:subfamily B ATP-binding cassette protein MsbA
MKSNIKRLFSYTLRYKLSFTVSIIGFLIFAAADVAAVEWIRRVIEFINSSDVVNPLFIAIALILIAFARGLGFFIGNYFMSRVGLGIVHDMRNELFNKLIKLPKIYFDNNQSGQLINRITFTTTQVSGATSNAVKTLVREGALFIGLISYMFYLNWKLTLLLLITAPFIAIIVNIAGRRLRKLAKSIQTAMGDVTHIASEAVEGNTEIKSFNAETYERDRFQKANTSNRNQNLKLEATSNLATPIIQILVSISLGIVAYFALGAQLGINLDSETFVAFFTSAGLMAKPIRQLSSINAIIQKGLAAADEIFDQLDSSDENDQGTLEPLIEGKIQFNDITFGYERSKDILKNINLVIENNETVAIVGKSGSGKSTLASLISRLYLPSTGLISIDGIDINEINLRHLRSHISIVSQNPTLFNDTIEKNIAYGYQEIDSERLNQAAELSGCMEFIEKLPEGFNTEIGDDGVLLSGGQRQRLAIARAFYKDAPIIILDEATSSLDSESELVVQSAIEKLIVNRTTIIIAHRLSTIEGANKIFVIDDGRIVEQGNHAELIDRDGIYKNLYKNMDSNQVKTAAVITKKEKSYLPSFVVSSIIIIFLFC